MLHSACAAVHGPDRGDGTYANPVLSADYSDPDCIRDGEDYWLTASSFCSTPGLPILHSRDLVNWAIVGHALRNLPGAAYERPRHGCGVWAPSLRKHGGRFWIVFPMPDDGIFVVTAAHPAGPWSEPWCLMPGVGLIDPCPLWDADGACWLVHAYAASRCGLKDRLRVVPVSADLRSVLGEGREVFHDPGRHPVIEGPKWLRRDGWYWILAPAGGVGGGWQVALRARHPLGPYEDRVVLEQGTTAVNGPHQGALVDAPDGTWWFLHFQERQPFGRIVHLQPAGWAADGWPTIGRPGPEGVGEPVAIHPKPVAGMSAAVPQADDDFADGPGPQWQWSANHRASWADHRCRPGWLRLAAVALAGHDLQQAANLLLQKVPLPGCVFTATVDPAGLRAGDRGGVVVFGRQHASLHVERTAGGLILGTAAPYGPAWSLPLGEGSAPARLGLRGEVLDGGWLVWWYRIGDGPWMRIRQVVNQVQPGVWVGARIGLWCSSDGGGGHLDVAGVRCRPASSVMR